MQHIPGPVKFDVTWNRSCKNKSALQGLIVKEDIQGPVPDLPIKTGCFLLEEVAWLNKIYIQCTGLSTRVTGSFNILQQNRYSDKMTNLIFCPILWNTAAAVLDFLPLAAPLLLPYYWNKHWVNCSGNYYNCTAGSDLATCASSAADGTVWDL